MVTAMYAADAHPDAYPTTASVCLEQRAPPCAHTDVVFSASRTACVA
jgi:hypothetical protein